MMPGLDRVERVIDRPLRHAHVDLKSWCCPARRRRELDESVYRDLVPVRDLVGLRRCGGKVREERQGDEQWQNYYFLELSQWIHVSSFPVFCFWFRVCLHRHKRKTTIKLLIR